MTCFVTLVSHVAATWELGTDVLPRRRLALDCQCVPTEEQPPLAGLQESSRPPLGRGEHLTPLSVTSPWRVLGGVDP